MKILTFPPFNINSFIFMVNYLLLQVYYKYKLQKRNIFIRFDSFNFRYFHLNESNSLEYEEKI